MSQASTLARPYARALFLLARDSGQLSGYSEALAFSAQAAAEPAMHALLSDPRIAAADLVALLIHPEAPANMPAFLAMLADNGRLPLLPETAELFEQLRAETERVVKATITSAAPLSDSDLQMFKQSLKNRFGSDVDVSTAVDPELIGGAVINAGDVVIDGSIRNKLARLNASLDN